MSSYIKIPNSITTKLTNKSKHEEALTYAIIRNEIKDQSLKSSIPEKQIADIINMSERTVNSYVSKLKNVGLLNEAEKKQGKSRYPYNVYQFDYLKEDYFMILPPILKDNNISSKLKGLLLFIKANCCYGTNYLKFERKTKDLAEKIGVGKNSDYLNELESKGYIRYIGKTLHITNNNFPLSINNDELDNKTYEIIYNFCLSKNIIPPVKKVDKRGKDKALSWIVGEYQNECDPSDNEQRPYGRLINTLNTRCSNLPKTVSLYYFCQALCNKKPPKEDLLYSDIII